MWKAKKKSYKKWFTLKREKIKKFSVKRTSIVVRNEVHIIALNKWNKQVTVSVSVSVSGSYTISFQFSVLHKNRGETHQKFITTTKNRRKKNKSRLVGNVFHFGVAEKRRRNNTQTINCWLAFSWYLSALFESRTRIFTLFSKKERQTTEILSEDEWRNRRRIKR